PASPPAEQADEASTSPQPTPAAGAAPRLLSKVAIYEQMAAGNTRAKRRTATPAHSVAAPAAASQWENDSPAPSPSLPAAPPPTPRATPTPDKRKGGANDSLSQRASAHRIAELERQLECKEKETLSAKHKAMAYVQAAHFSLLTLARSVPS
ncbi:MAG: hypothetical protein SGPRY_009243, partial [Prymnesium sp.]